MTLHIALTSLSLGVYSYSYLSVSLRTSDRIHSCYIMVHVSGTSIVLIPIAAYLLWLLPKLWRMGRRPADIPPGPPTIPIFGNLHQLPVDKPHLKLQQWAQEYG
jgi:hypothetical protein